jgi:hypothetical protein
MVASTKPPSSWSRAFLGLVAVAALSSCADRPTVRATNGPWQDGFPTGEPVVVTMENLNYEPPRMVGLVSEDHPAAQSSDAMLRKSGIKRVPVDRMKLLLDTLAEYRFLEVSQPLAKFEPVDSKVVLRRLTIMIGGERRAFTLARGPSKEMADCFNRQAIAVQAMFNETVDFRTDAGMRNPKDFFDVARKLFEAEKPGAKAAEKPGKGGAP